MMQRKLQALLQNLLPSNAFYARKYDGTGITPDISIDEFRAVAPFTTKAELVADQQQHSPYGSNLTYPLEQYTHFCQTSATTGTPMRWLDTPGSWAWMLDNWQQVYAAADVTRNDRCFFAFSFGPFLGFWTAFDAAQALGCLCVPGGGMRSLARLQAIIDNRITALCCTPTYAIHLGQVAANQGIDLEQAAVRAIIVAGEPGGSIPATGAHIEALWPTAKLYDHHGMTEVGPVSYQCPARPGRLHVIGSAYLVEVIDPETLAAVAPGMPGELVLTTLGRDACPLLRYRTGDLVNAPDCGTCECGTEDPALEGGILSRVDDMFIIRGVNVYPGAVEAVVRQFSEVEEYRVNVSGDATLRELSIEVEIAPKCSDAGILKKKISDALSTSFSMRIDVAIVASGTLPRFELKASRWIVST